MFIVITVVCATTLTAAITVTVLPGVIATTPTDYNGHHRLGLHHFNPLKHASGRYMFLLVLVHGPYMNTLSRCFTHCFQSGDAFCYSSNVLGIQL